jgi:hypothetical protein
MGSRKVPVAIARHAGPIGALASIAMTAIAIRLRRNSQMEGFGSVNEG